MSKGSLKPPSGFVEYNPQEQQIFDYLKSSIEKTYQSMGFIKTETPAAENLSTLISKGACDQEIFVLGRYGSDKPSDMGLRFDLTVPFARYVSAYQTDISFPFKRYQIDPVWRGERAQAGRYRQFYQCDVDIIAPESLSERYDAYMLVVLKNALKSIGIENLCIRVNHKELLELTAKHFGVPQNNLADFFRIIDKKDKVPHDKLKDELCVFLPEDSPDQIFQLFKKIETLSFDKSISLIESTIGSRCEQTQRVLQSLRDTYANFKAYGAKAEVLKFDLSIARGLNYYTGIIFETTWLDHAEIGSIASGGRYNDLVALFSKRPYRGIGFSIGLSRIFSVYKDKLLQERSLNQPEGTLILIKKEQIDNLTQEYDLYSRLLDKSLNKVDIYLQKKKTQDQIKYALSNNYRYTIEVVTDNGAIDEYRVRDLLEDKTNTFSLEQLLEFYYDK